MAIESYIPQTQMPLALPPTLSVFVTTVITAVFLLSIFVYSLRESKTSETPLVNPRKRFDFFNSQAKQQFATHATDILGRGVSANGDAPFRVISDLGDMTVLSPKFANEIKNDNRLSFSRLTYKAFHAHLPGFEPFKEGSRESHLIQDVVRTRLTQQLGRVTEPLSEECELALQEIFPDNKEWCDINLKQSIQNLVARISSRVFLGEELCRDPAWLRITIDYTVNSFLAASELRLWSAYLRPVVHWFLPSCRRLRTQVAVSRNIINSVLKKRREESSKHLDGEESEVKHNDAIDWFEQMSKGNYYDPAYVQLSLSLAAIHTTSDLITQVIYDLIANPELIEPLREEIDSILADGDWKKTSLYNMKLLDSVLKESQRLKPVSLVSMSRVVLSPTTLSNGTNLAPGTLVCVSDNGMRSPVGHSPGASDPSQFDGRRFQHLRSVPGNENVAQFVSTSPNHLAFGYGTHACPGRFFAANEAKIAMCHLLRRYDWKLADGQAKPEVRLCGAGQQSDPTVMVSVRRR